STDPRTVPQIARRLGVTRQNVQRIADLLVAENWAAFETNPDHRGSPFLVLNKRGQAALAEITRAATKSHAALARRLGNSDTGALHRGLRWLNAALVDRDSRREYHMNTATLSDCMTASFADTPFPVVGQRLAGAGVSAYTADLIALRESYSA